MPSHYYARLTQRLISALTVPTRRGTLYEVDMRLRPSGNKGPVATQFEGFVAYQRDEAETWEHMALTRARLVAGDASSDRRCGRGDPAGADEAPRRRASSRAMLARCEA